MTAQVTFRQISRVLRHFADTRAVEVLALQASPLLGMFLSGYSFELSGLIRPVLLLLGSLLLTAHVFFINDLAGYSTDIHDPRRTFQVFTERGISKNQVSYVATALLILTNVAFTAIGELTVLLGAAIAILSLLYSWSLSFGKGSPIMASVNHLLGGTLHFLLGYTLSRSFDLNGFLIGLFFGLVFAGGHLNQEVRDYNGDLLNKIRTNAVVFGCRRAFLASLFVFTAAYGLLACLASFGLLPRILLWSAVLWPLQVAWSLQALRRGLSFETASWMQKRYRSLFALIGLAIIASRLM
jgi:4-hydroxybenzoate polyprenyltransferase